MIASNSWTILRSIGEWIVIVLGSLFVYLIVYALICIMRDNYERKHAEFWVECISPGLLRGAEGELALVYHEDEKSLWFTGVDKVRFPSALKWENKMPGWAKQRRDKIIERIRRKYPQHCMSVDDTTKAFD